MSVKVEHPIKYNFFASVPSLSGKRMTAGEAILRYRKAHHLSREQFATLVNGYAKKYKVRFTVYDIIAYEKRGVSPKVGKMTALCKATGMSIGYYHGKAAYEDEVDEIVFAA